MVEARDNRERPHPATRFRTSFWNRYLCQSYRHYFGLKHRMSLKVSTGGWVLIGGLVCTGMMGSDARLAVAYQAAIFLCALIGISWWTLFLTRVELGVHRRVPQIGTVGERLPYRIDICNTTSRAQRGLWIKEQALDPRPDLEAFALQREPGESKRNAFDRLFRFYRFQWLLGRREMVRPTALKVPDLPPGGRVQMDGWLEPLRRGVLHLEGLHLLCPDILDCFRKPVFLMSKDKVVILPKRYPVHGNTPAGSSQYQPGGVSVAGAVGDSNEFMAVREYRRGDPLRRIHWPTSARQGALVVKEYQEEFFVRHGLILDTFSRVGEDTVFEEAVSVAASFACGIADQESLLDLMFVGNQAYRFTSGRGQGDARRILEILAGVQASPNPDASRLRELVRDHATALSACLCVFLEWDEPRWQLVEDLMHRQVPVEVFVVVEEGGNLDLSPGPLAGTPASFHVLEAGHIKEVSFG